MSPGRRIPRIDDERDVPDAAHADAYSGGRLTAVDGAPKVLIVEDEPASRLALETVLRKLDVQIFTAGSGEEALSAILTHDFAVILLDVGLPGMDGFETASLMRGYEPTRLTPIIFVTGRSEDETRFEGYRAGAVDYLVKPITPAVLESKVKIFADMYRMMADLEDEIRERRRAQERSRRIEAILGAIAFAAEEFLGPGSYREKVGGVLERLGLAVSATRVFVFENRETGGDGTGSRLRYEWAKAEGQPLADIPMFQAGVSEQLLGEWGEPLRSGVILSGTLESLSPERAGLPSSEGHLESLIVPIFVADDWWGVLGFLGRDGAHRVSGGELEAVRAASVAFGSAIERDRAVERHVHSEKMSAIGAMAAGIAHELNNPLMGILNFAQYCSKHTAPEHRTHEAILEIVRESTRCGDLLQNLLQFSHRGMPTEEGSLVLGSCGDLVERVLKIMSYRLEREGASVRVDFAADLPDVPLNADQMQQVILNLVANALDALEGCREKSIHLAAHRRGAFVRLTFEDTGPGIPPGVLDRIFDPFFTTKPAGKGTGLGLPICRHIVEDHGGTIRCESTPGRGTRFEISLPVAPGGKNDREQENPRDR